MKDPVAPLASHFHVDHGEVLARLARIDPVAYARTRNDLDGRATWLGPFLTHGVISTVDVADAALEGRKVQDGAKLLAELGWREFFHRTWQLEGEEIFADVKRPQEGVRSEVPPAVVLDGSTGVDGLDVPIRHLVAEGTMHNHARLWTAGITCNLARTWWHEPARWLHFHLIDGDLASNTLSWQWVAGTFSSKRYVANQDNVNKFAKTRQHDTWLDVSYEALDDFPWPEELSERRAPDYAGMDGRDALVAALTERGARPVGEADLTGDVALRSVWQLDPRWRTDVGRHVTFVDVGHATDWPMSAKRWDLIRHWSDACGSALLFGTVDELVAACEGADVVRTEYPACDGWPGDVEQRRWLYPMPDKRFGSFSAFWKQVKHVKGL